MVNRKRSTTFCQGVKAQESSTLVIHLFSVLGTGRQYKGGQRNYLAAQRRDVTSRGTHAEPASQPYGQCKGITMKSRSIYDQIKLAIRSIYVMRFPRAIGFC